MKLAVQLYASLAERAATRSLELELPEGATAADVWPAAVAALPALEGGPRPLVAVNLEYATPDTPLSDGDEVALLPPVSGG